MDETLDRILQVKEDLEFSFKQAQAVLRNRLPHWTSADREGQEGYIHGLEEAIGLLEEALEEL